MKTYPLQIRNCGGDDADSLMSKGHHDDAPFLAAARDYYGNDLKGFDAPARMWWRAMPDPTGEYASIYQEAEPHSRGAFPVTAICRW